jgi:geranylgeranyl pyrophosphate synthase
VASLLLDDLPCMDNAIVRRGFPCLHLEYGDATVILASLAFINRAYTLIWRALAPLPEATRLQANELLDRELGLAGMLNGQARDLRFGEKSPTAREAARIAVGKTVALFRLALAFPTLAGGASAAELKFINRLCVYWGLFYQACNDLNDVASGSGAARDAALDRPNLLLALGANAFDRRIDRLERQAGQSIKHLVRLNPAWCFLRGTQDSLLSSVNEPIRQALASRTG